MNMNAKRNSGTSEIRALSAVELDAVSGGQQYMGFDFKVAGMHIYGGGFSNGEYHVKVVAGDTVYGAGGKV
jgi:hypothetical protein